MKTKLLNEKREALYQWLLGLGVPDLLAALIAAQTVEEELDKRYGLASTHVLDGFAWCLTKEGDCFWVEVYSELWSRSI